MRLTNDLIFIYFGFDKNDFLKLRKTVKETYRDAKAYYIDDNLALLDIVAKLEIDALFLNVSQTTNATDVSTIKNINLLKYTPIILVDGAINHNELTKKFAMSLVNGFISLAYDSQKIHNIIKSVIPSTTHLNLVDKLMTNLIRALVRKNGAQDYALSMTSKALILCEQYCVNNDERFACISAVKYLASSLSINQSVYDAIRFFMELGFLNQTTKIMRELYIPNSTVGKIAHTVYFCMLNQIKFGNIEKFECNHIDDKSFAKKTKNLFRYHTVLLRSGYDAEMVLERILNLLIPSDINANKMQHIINQTSLLLTKCILFYGGGIVHQSFINGVFSLRIKLMQYETIDKAGIIEDIKSQLSFDFDITEEDKKFTIIINISELSAQNSGIIEPAQDNFDDFYVELSESNAHKDSSLKVKVSAREFLSNANLSREDILELNEILAELLDLANEATFSNNIKNVIEQIFKQIRKYGSMLMAHGISHELSDAFIMLGSILNEISNIEDNNKLEFGSMMLASLIEDISTWHNAIFIGASVDDISFMDESLISSCYQAVDTFFISEKASALGHEATCEDLFFF